MTRIIPTLLLLTAAGCSSGDPANRNIPEPFSKCTEAEGEPFLYDQTGTTTDGEPTGPYLDGTTLIVPLNHSGRCEEHTFVLCWPTRRFLRPSTVVTGDTGVIPQPDRAPLEVWKNDPDDECEELAQTVLEQSLQPLIDIHEGTNPPLHTLLIDIDRWTLRLDY